MSAARPATTVPLDYSPPPRWHRRRAVRFGVKLLLLAGLVAAGWRWGPRAWRHGRVLYWQRQCLAYAASADRVVYETDPARAAALLDRDGYVNDGANNAPVAAYVPRCWD